MILKKELSVSICLFLSTIAVNAQNHRQIAYNEANTSFDKMEIMSRNYEYEHPASDVYDLWDNERCHLKNGVIPNTYRIDLRKFSMPVRHTHITSNFGYRAKFKRNHNGVDIKAYIGDTIYAAFDGKVRVVKFDPKGYGKVIVIRHYNGLETVYGHLSKQNVIPNEHVEAGQVIGLAGNTGRSTGSHLHFETRFCGIPINPNHIFTFGTKDVVDDFYVFKK